jgi:uncharacterized protein YeeX (DUF496 family)
MPDAQPTSFLPPALVRASAYTPSQVAQLGAPRGLVPHTTTLPATTDSDFPVAASITPQHANAEAPGIAAPTLGLGPRTRFRFHAHDAEFPVVPPSNLTSDPVTARRAGAVRKTKEMPSAARWLSLCFVAIAAAAAGYYFGLPVTTEREVGNLPSLGASEGRGWTQNDRERLNDILLAESRQQTREMNDLVRQLRDARPRLAGLSLLEARAAMAARTFSEAEVSLQRAAQDPFADKVEIHLLRAANFGQQRYLKEMRSDLGDAIALDPTRAEFHYQRAEVDRRQGRTQESLAGYSRAMVLAKPNRFPSRETIEFRRRLLLIESGRESELDAKAYNAAFAQPSPSGDWLLTAAAVALQRKDAETAARWLRAAREAMPWPDYVERIDDYFFRIHTDEPNLKDLFPTRVERAQIHAVTPPILKDP